MMWTASKPKLDGWYVAIRKGKGLDEEPALAYFDANDGELYDGKGALFKEDYRLWFGPLPQLVPNSVV